MAKKKIEKVLTQLWKDGARISDLETEHDIKRSRIRRMIQIEVGGKDAFRQLRENGAGGTTEPFGGKRGQPPALPDDSKVKRIKSAKHKMAGGKWSVETGPDGILIHVSPKTTKYVKALPQEKADLIYEHKDPSLGITRLRKLETSAAARKARKKAKQRAQGAEAITRRRAAKREKRKTRIRRKLG